MNRVTHIVNKLLAAIILILCALVSNNVLEAIWLSSTLLALQFLLIIEFSRFKPFAIFIFFTISYTIPPHLHFFDERYIIMSDSFDFAEYKYYKGVFVILSLFWGVFCLMLPRLKKQIIIRENLLVRNNAFMFYSISIIFLLIILFGKTGENIFSSGGYGHSQVTQAGGVSLYEYGGFLFLIAYCFSGNLKFRSVILISLGIIFCIKSLLLGGRINTIFMLLLIFILYLDNRKVSLFQWMLLGLPLIAFFLGFQFVRTATNDGLAVLKENVSFFESKYLVNSVLLGNQRDIFFASTRLYGFCETGILSTSQRLETFSYNMLAFIVPYGKLPDIANLAAFKQDEYYSGGGALMPVFFYVYLSYFGVVFIATLIGYFFRRFISNTYDVSQAFTVYIIALLVSYTTWYGYSANNLYKFCVYAVIAYGLSVYFYNFFFKKNNQNSFGLKSNKYPNGTTSI